MERGGDDVVRNSVGEREGVLQSRGDRVGGGVEFIGRGDVARGDEAVHLTVGVGIARLDEIHRCGDGAVEQEQLGEEDVGVFKVGSGAGFLGFQRHGEGDGAADGAEVHGQRAEIADRSCGGQLGAVRAIGPAGGGAVGIDRCGGRADVESADEQRSGGRRDVEAGEAGGISFVFENGGNGSAFGGQSGDDDVGAVSAGGDAGSRDRRAEAIKTNIPACRGNCAIRRGAQRERHGVRRGIAELALDVAREVRDRDGEAALVAEADLPRVEELVCAEVLAFHHQLHGGGGGGDGGFEPQRVADGNGDGLALDVEFIRCGIVGRGPVEHSVRIGVEGRDQIHLHGAGGIGHDELGAEGIGDLEVGCGAGLAGHEFHGEADGAGICQVKNGRAEFAPDVAAAIGVSHDGRDGRGSGPLRRQRRSGEEIRGYAAKRARADVVLRREHDLRGDRRVRRIREDDGDWRVRCIIRTEDRHRARGAGDRRSRRSRRGRGADKPPAIADELPADEHAGGEGIVRGIERALRMAREGLRGGGEDAAGRRDADLCRAGRPGDGGEVDHLCAATHRIGSEGHRRIVSAGRHGGVIARPAGAGIDAGDGGGECERVIARSERCAGIAARHVRRGGAQGAAGIAGQLQRHGDVGTRQASGVAHGECEGVRSFGEAEDLLHRARAGGGVGSAGSEVQIQRTQRGLSGCARASGDDFRRARVEVSIRRRRSGHENGGDEFTVEIEIGAVIEQVTNARPDEGAAPGGHGEGGAEVSRALLPVGRSRERAASAEGGELRTGSGEISGRAVADRSLGEPRVVGVESGRDAALRRHGTEGRTIILRREIRRFEKPGGVEVGIRAAWSVRQRAHRVHHCPGVIPGNDNDLRAGGAGGEEDNGEGRGKGVHFECAEVEGRAASAAIQSRQARACREEKTAVLQFFTPRPRPGCRALPFSAECQDPARGRRPAVRWCAAARRPRCSR